MMSAILWKMTDSFPTKFLISGSHRYAKNIHFPIYSFFGKYSLWIYGNKEYRLYRKNRRTRYFLFGKKYFGTSVAQKVALCWEIIMKNIGMKTCISRIHGNNFRSIKFFQKIGGVFRYKEGNMYIFEHEFQRRRRALGKMARSLGQYDEYTKLLHDDLPVATVTTASG